MVEIFEGKTITLSEEDLLTLIKTREVTTENKNVRIAIKPSANITEKEVKTAGKGSFHVYVPIQVGRKHLTVFVVPGKLKEVKK